MKEPSILLAKRYVAALKKHLETDPQADVKPTFRLGHRNLAGELGMLYLARIHDQTMLALFLPDGSSETRRVMSERADVFFAQAHAAFEVTQRSMGRSDLDWQKLNATLDRRTNELAGVKVRLRQGIAERKLIQNAHKKRGKLHQKCLEESLQLQKRLRQLTHRLFAAQEDERQKISQELENEIAQTLLAINVRLLTLKKEAWNSTEAFKENIASTQRFLMTSVQAVRQAARKAGKK